jgi:predicted enzyme related to lactoylglutathione lyase
MTSSSSSESIAKLGAKVIHPKPAEGRQWVVMIDPEGNEFCVST